MSTVAISADKMQHLRQASAPVSESWLRQIIFDDDRSDVDLILPGLVPDGPHALKPLYDPSDIIDRCRVE